MNGELKDWMKILILIQDNVPNVPRLICPRCHLDSIDFQYVGDPHTRFGYLAIWCKSYLHGITVYKQEVPKEALLLSDQLSEEEISRRIPNYKLLAYLN